VGLAAGAGRRGWPPELADGEGCRRRSVCGARVAATRPGCGASGKLWPPRLADVREPVSWRRARRRARILHTLHTRHTPSRSAPAGELGSARPTFVTPSPAKCPLF